MRAFTFAALLLASACTPSFEAALSIVTSTKIVAVRGIPAEGAAGTKVTWDALVVAPNGTVTSPPLDWSFCLAPKPEAEVGSVADQCFGGALDSGNSIGGTMMIAEATATAMGAIPSNACQLFGPELMPGMPNERPRSPDVTGGYYQPLRVDLVLTNAATIALERVRCNLVGASMTQALDFQMRYHANQNPQLVSLAAQLAITGGVIDFAAVPANAELTLTATWSDDSAETYPVFDVVTSTITDHRESLRVSWFATDGKWAANRTGRDASELETVSTNQWHTPTTLGPANLWIVVRDDRGGIDWLTQPITIVATP